MVVVISFLFVLGTNGRMQPVVMAPKNLDEQYMYRGSASLRTRASLVGGSALNRG